MNFLRSIQTRDGFFSNTLMRTKQLYFPKCITPVKRDMKCTACNQPGHNKKNKSCPLHPSHPTIEFDDSEDETEKL